MNKRLLLLSSLLLLEQGLFAKKQKIVDFPTAKLGLQVVLDAAWIDNGYENEPNQEIRRARLFTKGKLLKNWDYEVEYSLTGGGKWKDLYLSYTGLPNDIELTLGHVKEPFGLEALTSSKYNTFMERALPSIFILDRKLGMRLSWEEHQKNDFGFGASLGVFGQSINDLNSKDDKNAFAIRAYNTNYFTPESFFHIGLSSAYTNIGNQDFKLSSRAESHLSHKIIKSKIEETNFTLRYGIESIFQYGSFSLQSEYLLNNIKTMDRQTYNFSAWYAQMSYFFTDDQRRYKLKDGVYGRIKTNHSLENGGIGAWEGALRISQLDLEEDGEVYEYTVGLNWYIIDHMRVMANYIKTDLEDKDDNLDIIQLRLQYDF